MKEKGFTLIELLAVIVILAIIALIAVPMVLNIIDNTKDSSVIRSTELYLDAVELYIARNQLDNKQIEDGQHNIQEFTKVEIKGQAPSEGMVELLEGKIVDYSLQIGEYVVNYSKDKKKAVADKNGILRKVKYKDSTGAEIEIIDGFTPVKYNGTNWVVADIYSEWYDYANQEWANAVILETGVTKNIGDTVNVSSEVKAMFVYIPRYEYKIEGQYGTHPDGTVGTQELPGEIKVNFVPKTKNGVSNEYRVHPAFTFGDEELGGIWVGKFETTGTGENPTILPSVKSLGSQNVSTQFATAQKFNNYITNGDSHMAKNSEWDAVSYLSQSKYGKYGNAKYSGLEKEVRINNCSNYITGIGADSQSANSSADTCTTNTYITEKGQAASTTGNATGVYDMSGGAMEHVMGVILDTNGKILVGYNIDANSGYTGILVDGTNYNGKDLPEVKYYNEYTKSCSGEVCYVHALGETMRWYGDGRGLSTTNGSWLNRGNNCYGTTTTGVFYFTTGSGSAYSNHSFRVVVSKNANS